MASSARKPFGSCKTLPNNLKFVPRLSSLRRSLIGEGSHRYRSSLVRLDVQLNAPTELPPHNCAVIILERLPSGVYADPFELQNLIQHGEFSDIADFGDTNSESPSFLSNRSALEVYMDVGPLLSSSKNELDVVVELPLHARYDLYMKVSIGISNLVNLISSCDVV